MKNEKNNEFNAWMKRIDRICSIKIGVSIHDLPDQPFSDYFEDAMTPQEVFEQIAENEGLYFEEGE